MTYKEFKIECHKSVIGELIWHLWITGKAPLYPLMELFEAGDNF